MRVGLDLDGTVYQWDRTARYLLRQWYLERTGRELPDAHALRQPSAYYDYIKDSLLADDELGRDAWRWLWSKDGGIARGLFRDGHIYTGCQEAVRKIGDEHDLVIITKRPPSAVPDTMDFLAYRRWPIAEVHTLTARDALKSDVLPRCDVYIDDAQDVLYDLKTNTDGYVIGMDRAWNAHAVCDYRARSWTEVTYLVDGLAAEDRARHLA